MTKTPTITGMKSAPDPQPKALQVAAILRERLGIDCLAAELLESQHARIVELQLALAVQAQDARGMSLNDEMLQKLYDQFLVQHPESTAEFSAFNWFMAGATIADCFRAVPRGL
ncbi:hypothetical protein [Comamonas antarctica]|uniref:Uncharacterized protein n=1 Tax=Comamonas antarctica TaxID=2743470 RepID=A0A6N1WZ45_9BURK|nr:hypothetical protein [Comamonas antarctica]QKV52361.1 hypothetical protein HUK68_05260 [Comamonas antarctica]